MKFIVIALLVVAFLAVIALCIFLTSKATNSSDKKSNGKFRTVMYIQSTYDRIRKQSRIPCSVLFIKVGFDNSEILANTQNAKKTLDHISGFLLSSFGHGEDNLIASLENKEFVVLTRMSEPDIDERIVQINKAVRLYSRENSLARLLQLNVGAYLIPASNVDFEEAVQRCRLACMDAVEKKLSYVAWDYNLQKTHEEASTLDESFANNLEANNFFIEFQPIVDTKTGNICCAEALTRLNREDVGIVKPVEFIPIISNIGINDKFDYMILDKTCKWLSTRQYLFDKLNHISVNFSRATIEIEGFADRVIEIIDNYNLPHKLVAVEILEDKDTSDVNIEVFTGNIHKLRDSGITILLDDFGVGHTSFDDIRNCPTDILKIDQSIIRNTDSEIGVRVFRSILNVAQEIGAEVICEGVEKPEQLDILKELNCNLVQGFYFYHPMRPDQFEKLIKNNF